MSNGKIEVSIFAEAADLLTAGKTEAAKEIIGKIAGSQTLTYTEDETQEKITDELNNIGECIDIGKVDAAKAGLLDLRDRFAK